MESGDYVSLVLYYGRARFYYSMQKAALDGLAKYPTQSAFRLFNGFALALGNRMQEGIRELNPLKNELDLGLGAALALIYAHKKCSVVDRDALLVLEQRLQEEDIRLNNANAAYYAGVFSFLIGNIEQARFYADKCLKIDGYQRAAIVLKAWAELCGKTMITPASGNVLRSLEAVLVHGKNIDATLAEVRYYQLRGQFDDAIGVLNKLSVRLPELNIPLIEKMETQLAALDWEHAYETAQRILNLEPSNISALRIKALVLLGRDGNVKGALQALQQLLTSIERVENGNYELMLLTCQLFGRICSRNRDVLTLTCRFVDKMVQAQPNQVHFIAELGYQWLMLGNCKEAESHFRAATKLDDNYFNALCGLTLCQFIENRSVAIVETQQQIELLEELCNQAEKQEPMLLFLRALATEASDRAVALLVQASELHLQSLEQSIFGPHYVHQLQPDFLLQITVELLRHCPVKVHVNYEAKVMYGMLHITLKQCLSILEVLLRSVPGHVQAIYMRAKVEFLGGEATTAALTLQRILSDIDPTCTDAHLLLAQIQLQQQLFSKATQTLEIALSHNFAVREHPMYYLLFGIIQKQQKQLLEAQKSFLTAMQLVGSTYMGAEQSREKLVVSSRSTAGSFITSEFSISDKVTLYLNLITVFRDMNDAQGAYESERLLQCALEEFSGTPEEGRLVIAHADLMLQNCNVEKAVQLLTAVQYNQSYYVQAKTHLARIYLKYRKDRFAYAKCFKELADVCPEIESYITLGEAYMSIQEPDLAIEAYHKASAMNPNDTILASKLGRTYVKAHMYNKAIKFYQEALKNRDHVGLKLDLAELYLKLKQYRNAVTTLDIDLTEETMDDMDIAALQFRTKELLLLARVYEKSGDISLSLQTLRIARNNQYRVQKRVSVDQSSNLYEQYKILSKICLLLAKQYISLRDNNEALSCLKECLKYTPNDIEILSALARLYMQMNSMEELCREVCMKILQIDSNNEIASVMMADLSFRKMDFENAAYHFSQLLLSKPNYWTALARLIEVMRRSGTLQEANSFLQRAEQITAAPTQCAGLNYCQGLYEWYSGNPNAALRHFNAGRRSSEWGQQAIFNMIEICINPDGDIVSSGDVQDALDAGEVSESRTIALRTAERLLKELRPRPGGIDDEALNHRLLHNFLKMAAKQKFQIESALQDFTELASREEYQNLVGPVLGMASALVLLKQSQRAKNHLKRIVRFSWNFEEAEYFERAWLLLADIYLHANKLDMAMGFIDRVLEHNKSSTKAYELAGYTSEKSQMYREAAKHFHNAWNYGGRSKPHIGYKLAYNYMKSKLNSDAIDICQQVMKLHPDYVVIRKDIYDKCRNSLRP